MRGGPGSEHKNVHERGKKNVNWFKRLLTKKMQYEKSSRYS